MIHIDRSQISTPVILADEKKTGRKETLKAIKHYRDQLAISLFNKPFDQLEESERDKVIHFAQQQVNHAGNGQPAGSLIQMTSGKNFNFKCYTQDEIKQALHKLFHGKCAYCESRFASTQPMDVEHWRPKGGFIDENDSESEKLEWPGYYWLAADWSNLLPSCIDCNRRRNQVVWSQEKPLRLGKESQFPIADVRKRWRDPDQENEEEPLLLNPCDENPEDWPELHLRFDQEAVILPREDPKDGSRLSQKAIASIRVYALNRTELVLARQERLRLLEYHKQTILQLSNLLEQMESIPLIDEELLTVVEDLLAFEFAFFEQYKESDQPYALLARQFIDEFMNDLK